MAATFPSIRRGAKGSSYGSTNHVDRAGPYSAGAEQPASAGTSGKQPWRLVGYFERFT
jgi:hypothetical protein